MARRFEIDGRITRQYRRFNDVGTQHTVRLLPPSDDGDPVSNFLASMNDLFDHTLQNVSDSDMVGITIQNQVNQNEKTDRNQFYTERSVIWSRDMERL